MHTINGNTELIAHIGFPTHAFKAPMIYNPYFEQAGINAVVVPMGCAADSFPSFLRSIFSLSNIRGALITMPHKVTTTGLVDALSPAAAIAGACNAVKKDAEGKLIGDMFDGEGFVRGVQRKGLTLKGASALVVGCGGVGSAIAASLAGADVARLQVADVHVSAAESLCDRLRNHYPQLQATPGSNDPSGFDLVVNATPLGMNEGDALPFDVAKLSASTFVGEVVMKSEMTTLLKAAAARGCPYQIGTDMLFEQIPAYLEFFGLPTTTPEHLRAVAKLSY
jgi:shikimate dehydrogenase